MPAPPQAQDDELVFADEAPVLSGGVTDEDTGKAGDAWRVMIVDDDADVHSTTTFALGSLEVHGRRLAFLHAYSAAEAKALLEREGDIAVVLLDVVMEEADAGLHLVRHIRETLCRHDLRIILRTGQPGYTPEMDAIRGYDINDYRT
jgi:CheY-like chemotaxis protein